MISSYYIYFCAEELWEIKKLKKEEATMINSKKIPTTTPFDPQIITNVLTPPTHHPYPHVNYY